MSRPRTIQEHLDTHYKNNPYIKGVHAGPTPQSQQPKRMHKPRELKRPKTVEELLNSNYIPTEAELDYFLAPPEVKAKIDKDRVDPGREHMKGLDLVNRHRYGDDIDILRANFTRTKEEIEQEKFHLITAARDLLMRIHCSLIGIPKHEKYNLGADIRNCVYTVMKHSQAIKKRYYRKNMLEFIDIELDTLRELFFVANKMYPSWMSDAELERNLSAINIVGAIVGGLLKTTVV